MSGVARSKASPSQPKKAPVANAQNAPPPAKRSSRPSSVTPGSKPSSSQSTRSVAPPPQPPPGSLGSVFPWLGGTEWRVVYVGPVFFADGAHIGLEQLRETSEGSWLGDTDGTIEGTQYFACRAGRGKMVPRDALDDELRAQRQIQSGSAPLPPVASRTVVAGVGSLLAVRQQGASLTSAPDSESPVAPSRRPRGGDHEGDLSGWGAADDDPDVALLAGGVGAMKPSADHDCDLPRDGICVGLRPDDTPSPTRRQRASDTAPPVASIDCDCQTQITLLDALDFSRVGASRADASTTTDFELFIDAEETTRICNDDTLADAAECQRWLARAETCIGGLLRAVEEMDRRWAPAMSHVGAHAEALSARIAAWEPPTIEQVRSSAVAADERDTIDRAAGPILERIHDLHHERNALQHLRAELSRCSSDSDVLNRIRHAPAVDGLERLLRRYGDAPLDSLDVASPESVEAAVLHVAAEMNARCGDVVADALRPLASHITTAISYPAALRGGSLQDWSSGSLPDVKLLIDLVCAADTSSEAARRLIFNAADMEQQAAACGADGDVHAAEDLGFRRLEALKAAQSTIIEDALERFPTAIKALLDSPRVEFDKTLAATVEALKHLEREATAMWSPQCAAAEMRLQHEAELRQDTFVRTAFAISAAYAAAKAQFDEAQEYQSQHFSAAIRAIQECNSWHSRAQRAFNRVRSCAAEKMRLLEHERSSCRDHIIRSEVARAMTASVDAFVTLLRTLQGAWCPEVEEREHAALMELQRDLHERRRALHDLHLQAARALCHAAGELEWRKDHARRAICDRLRTTEAELAIAAESLDPAAKQIAARRNELQAILSEAEKGVAALTEVCQTAEARFTEHSGRLLAQAGWAPPLLLDEVKKANEARQARIEGIVVERVRLLSQRAD